MLGDLLGDQLGAQINGGLALCQGFLDFDQLLRLVLQDGVGGSQSLETAI